MSDLIQGKTGEWEVVIGLETHAQIVAEAKLFSGAATAFGAAPNSQVSTVDAAFPGMLPVINRRCVEQAVRTGLGLNATIEDINLFSVFDRKSYFYPDLPAGYQISQYQQPVVCRGIVEIDLADGTTRQVRITRLHLEQDAGKSLHDQHPRETYVDLNRAGIGLMEIVSEPDLRSAEEAGLYLSELRLLLSDEYLGTCDGNMEEGSLRCDCNVSVRRPGEPYGTRCEIKNLNSVRFVVQAIEIEARRQIALIEDGGKVAQETRLFDPNRGETRPMRSKENDYDYRYFPDPDLLPLELDKDWVEKLRGELPELPRAKRARFVKDHRISAEKARRLSMRRAIADAYEGELCKEDATRRDADAIANWFLNDYIGLLEKHSLDMDRSPIRRGQIGILEDCVQEGIVSRAAARKLFAEMFEFNYADRDPRQLIEEKGLRQVSDTGAIEATIDAVLAAHPAQVTQHESSPKVFGYLVGQVMKATGGKANPALVNELLRGKLARGSSVSPEPLVYATMYPGPAGIGYVYQIGAPNLMKWTTSQASGAVYAVATWSRVYLGQADLLSLGQAFTAIQQGFPSAEQQSSPIFSTYPERTINVRQSTAA